MCARGHESVPGGRRRAPELARAGGFGDLQGEEALPTTSCGLRFGPRFHTRDVEGEGGLAHGGVVVGDRPVDRDAHNAGDINRIDGSGAIRAADHEAQFTFTDTPADEFIDAPASQMEGYHFGGGNHIDRVSEIQNISAGTVGAWRQIDKDVGVGAKRGGEDRDRVAKGFAGDHLVLLWRGEHIKMFPAVGQLFPHVVNVPGA